MAIRAKAEITISRIIDIQSVTRYYLLQSSTSATPNKPSVNPPISPWTKTEPSYSSGSTTTLYFVDCTEYTNDTFSYSEVSKSSSYEAAKVAYNKAVNVESRINTAETQIEQNTTEIDLRATKTEVNALIEGNLIVNGFGLNRDNYNFNQWTYDGTDKCDGYPSFSYTGKPTTLYIPQYMVPIDISKTYEFKMNFKGDSSKKLYLGRDEFDIDGNYISPTYSMGFSASTTTLAQDLKNGDAVVYLTSASGWTSTTATHQLGLIFWNYKDSTGYQYPAGVYSRNAWTNLYTFGNVDKTNNTITLTSAWSHGTFPAGTQVSQSNSSGHKYFNYTNTYYPADWTETSFTIGGVQSLYTYQSSKFNQAAKYMRFIILHNYSGGTTTSTTNISKISLCDATLKKNLADNYYNKTQTDALIKIESDKITSAVSRISNNEKLITTTAEDASRAQEAADTAQETAVEAESLIKQLADNISMLVTDGNGTSLMTQTDDGWVFSTAELQTAVNATSEGLGTLVNDLSDTNSAVGVLQQAVDDLGVLTDYITIGTYDSQPCIELGETDSDFKLRITNTQVVYTEGATVLAYFTNQSMHIKKAVIEEELQQGGFVWKVRSNGNMGLVWKGATS